MSKEENYNQGMEYFGEDQLDLAIQVLEKALEEDAEYGDDLHAAAMCCYHNKDLDKAIDYGTRFKDVEPDNPLAYTGLSMFFQAKGWIERAEEMGGKAQAVGFEEAQREVQEGGSTTDE